MASESKEKKRERVRTLIKALRATHPDAKCALHHDSPFQLLIATILSAQCTDEKVNQVTEGLFRRFPGPRELAAANLPELEKLIRPTGFFKNKSKSIRGASQAIIEKYGGRVPQTMEELIELPGVGRKTANVVLGVAFHIANGIVVDTHVARLSFRLGLTSRKTPVDIEKDLQEIVPKEEWIHFSHLLIFHGRRFCKAQRPLCGSCPISELCPKRGVTKKG